MKKKSASRSAFFNLRFLIGLRLALGGVALALAQPGTFSAVAAKDVQAKVKNQIVTQSMTFTAANPDNPNQIVVAYNDSRGRNANPINISGASVSTDGGLTFDRLTRVSTGQSPFANTVGDPVILYNKPSSTWFTVWIGDGGCGGGLGGYKSTTPWDPESWTHYPCVHSGASDDRESGYADNNLASPFFGRMYVSWNNFAVGGGAIRVVRSSDNGATWSAAVTVAPTFIRNVQITGDKITGAVYIAGMDEMGGGL